MNPFSINGARHYCASSPSYPGTSASLLSEFPKRFLYGPRHLDEGDPIFDDYRESALKDVEMSIFLAASHYRRALDLMIPSSGHWAHVTLYYGAWYAARALLGMFGCTVADRQIVHVDRSRPGQQRLRIQRLGMKKGQHPISRTGSHRVFWELFYQAASRLAPFISDPQDRTVLLPVSNDSSWLIDRRNKVNYDPERSILVGVDLARNFSPSNFPSSLPGDLSTQYRVCEGLLRISHTFASDFNVETDALDSLSTHCNIDSRICGLVYQATPPRWTDEARRQAIFAFT